ITLYNKLNNLDEIIVNGNKKITEVSTITSETIKEMDVILNSSDVNIISAIDNTSGAQQIGETGELAVRGGAGAETKYFFDGMILRNQLVPSIQGQSSSFRFSPSFFKDLEFNASDYSSEYGQALSSILIMKSKDRPIANTVGFLVSPFFFDVETTWLINDKESLEVKGNYTNFGLYSQIQKPNLSYLELEKGPISFDGTLFYKYKINEDSYFKLFSYTAASKITSASESIDNEDLIEATDVKNINSYNLATLNYSLSKKTKLNFGMAFAHNTDMIRTDIRQNLVTTSGNPLEIRSNDFHFKGNLKTAATKSLSLNVGSEFFHQEVLFKSGVDEVAVTDNLVAAHAEGTLRLIRNLYTSAGIRAEYSSLTKKNNIAPRFNLKYENDKKWNVSLSYGIYFQQTSPFYLLESTNIEFLKASNFVLSIKKNFENHAFKVEVYDKNYNRLIRNQPTIVDASGSGYARGIDISTRGRNIFNKFNYSFNYSYLDTKRLHRDFPIEANVPFASKHTASFGVNTTFFEGDIITGLTYKYASGRPYFNPNRSNAEFNTDITPAYQTLNANIIYSTKIKKTPVLFITTITNALGKQQIFGYNYSTDFSNRRPIQPLFNRFIFVGCLITLGLDKSDEFIDNLINN
ncbi:TonB-dependent receptor, partial [Flavobacteriaceae bacterium]|nr:TonB-dependent receptor [Flavobacteriaceae bacterium]